MNEFSIAMNEEQQVAIVTAISATSLWRRRVSANGAVFASRLSPFWLLWLANERELAKANRPKYRHYTG